MHVRWFTSFHTIAVALFVTAASVTIALAQVQIDITRGRVEPMPIAVVNFSGNETDANRIGRDLSAVISNNLERSGLFRPIDRDAFIQSLPSLDVQPRFADWRALAAQALVQGEIEAQSNGQLRVAFRLWDVFGGQQMIGQAYVTQPENWRRVAHIIADAIYTQITGNPDISIPGWSMCRKAARATPASNGWQSWTRMAPTTAS